MTKKLFVAIILILTMGLFSANAQTKPQGSGTQSSPYQIGTYNELLWFAGMINGTLDGVERNSSACAELTADITINNKVLKASTIDISDDKSMFASTYELNGSVTDYTAWVPIAKLQSLYYSGTFDGKGYTISGMEIDVQRVDIKEYGLFGYCKDATIKNLNIKDSYVFGQTDVGGICGLADHSTISNCTFDGYVLTDVNDKTTDYIGAICGLALNATITNCSAKGYLTSGSEYIGGIVGRASSTDISWCVNEASILGTASYAGGIAGYFFQGDLTDCYNLGTVSGSLAGGVAGYCYADEEDNCWSYGTVYDVTDGNGQAVGSGTSQSGFSSVYYLNEGTTLGRGVQKDTSAFKGGEVTYLLNGDQSTLHYYQTLGTDLYPTTDATHKIVYAITNCQGKNVAYTNDKNAKQGIHSMKKHTGSACYDTYWTCEYEDGVYYADSLGKTKIADLESIAHHDWVYDTVTVATPAHTGLVKVSCSRDASHPQKTLTLHKLDCLWFTAAKANSTVKLKKVGTLSQNVSLSYSTDTLTWKNYTFGTAIKLEKVGSFVCFKATDKNSALASDTSKYCQFVMTGSIVASGNVESLLNDSAQTSAQLPDYAFCNLFKNCKVLTQAPNLTSTYLGKYSCLGMFEGCTGLTKGADVLAEIIDEGCCMRMYKGCTSLKSAPSFTPSFGNNTNSSISKHSFEEMFSGCTSLTSTPSVRGIIHAYGCKNMYKGCTSLKSAPAIETPYVEEYGCYGMFSGCTALTSTPSLSNEVSGDGHAYARMFENCTALEESPYIYKPRQSGIKHCYDSMFVGCSKLHLIKTNLNAWEVHTCNWVVGVADSGTFICLNMALPKIYGDSCIPRKWSYHTLTKTTVCEPTCTTDGYTQEVWVCAYDDCKNVCYKDELAQEKASSSIILPAIGHNWYKTDTVQKATCGAEGKIVRYCKNDNSHIDTVYIAKLPHNWGDWDTTTAPTCVERGILTRYCKNDKLHVEHDTLDYGDHKWSDESEVITKATELSKGVSLTHCVYNTNHVRIDSIPFSGDHDWVIYSQRAANCMYNGYSIYECSMCGKMDTIIIPSDTSLHSWSLYRDRKSTCSTAGYKVWRCNYGFHQDTIKYALEPDAHAWSALDTVKKPTCSTQGIAIKVCGYNTNHIDTTYIDIDSSAHAFLSKQVAKEATCTDKGLMISYCAYDSTHIDSLITDVDPTNHEWGEWDIVRDPICAVEGLRIRVCKNDASHIDSISMGFDSRFHEWGAWDTIRTGNCVQSGLRIRYCIYDSTHTESYEFSSLSGHDWGEWDTIVAPGCNYYGKRVRICKNDTSHVKTELLEPIYHSWIVVDTIKGVDCDCASYVNYVCAHDSSHTEMISIPPIGHNYGEWDTLRVPTCSLSGQRMRVCLRCGYKYIENMDSLGHLWGKPDTLAATCTAPAQIRRVCQNDASHVDTVMVGSALGHLWGKPDTLAATCIAPKQIRRVCQRDANHLDIVVLDSALLGHSWVNTDTVAVATCTTPAQVRRVCQNDASHVDTVMVGSALGHSWGNSDTVVVATCTTPAQVRRVCQNDASHVDTVIVGSALGHSMVQHKGVPATCTETGVKEYWICTREADILYADSMGKSTLSSANLNIAALGHNWVVNDTLLAPTCTKRGHVEYICTNDSSHRDTVSIRSLGHNWTAYDTTDYNACFVARERTCLNEVNGLHKDTLRYACDDVVIYDKDGKATNTKWREYANDTKWFYTPTENSLLVTDNEKIKGNNVVLTSSEGNTCNHLILNDGYGFVAPVTFVANYFDIDRMATDTVETLVLPVNLPVSCLKGKAYEFTGKKDGQFTFALYAGDTLKANTPYLIKETTPDKLLVGMASKVTVVAGQPEYVTIDSASFFGTYQEKDLETSEKTTYYMLSEGEFSKTATAALHPFRAALCTFVGELTGIKSVTPLAVNSKVNVFDVLGRLIRFEAETDRWSEGLKDGIYIANGHKYIVKEQKIVGSK